MQLEQVMFIVSALCILLIVLLIFLSKASYDEGYIDGYGARYRESSADPDVEYRQGYENGYADAMRKIA